MKRVLVLCSLLAFACGGNEGAKPVDREADAGVDTDVDTACQSYAAAYCERLEECAGPYLDRYYGEREACELHLVATCPYAFALPGIQRTSSDLAACAEDTLAASCESFNRAEECTWPEGTLADGEACNQYRQCKSGYCTSSQGTACGICQTLRKVGETCTQELVCEDGAGCLFEQDAEQGVCTRNAGIGEPCGAELCNWDGYCAPSGQCEPLLPEGASCLPDDYSCEFYSGLECIAGKCQAPALAKVGEACGDMGDGKFLDCAASDCDTALGKCVPWLAKGAKCEADSDLGCGAGLACIDGTCRDRELSLCE